MRKGQIEGGLLLRDIIWENQILHRNALELQYDQIPFLRITLKLKCVLVIELYLFGHRKQHYTKDVSVDSFIHSLTRSHCLNGKRSYISNRIRMS
jgi:hypothetical protein